MSDLHHLAAAYALDAVDADERRAFEAHLPSCDICAADVHDHRETAAQLAAATSVAPPTELRDRVLAEIHTTRQLPALVADRPLRRRRPAWLLVAAAVALVAGVVGAITLRDTGDGGVADVLEARDAVISPLDATADGEVTVIWSASEGRAVLLGRNLATAGEARTYELWQLTPDGPRPAGLFDPGSDGAVTLALAVDLVDAPAWGVTIEPAGGSDQPTGDILFASA